MATREERRARLVPRVARTLRSRDFRASFSALGCADRHVIIVALPDDTVGYVFDQLAAASGSAVLVMPTGERLEMAILAPATSARIEVATEDDNIAQVHEHSEVGMLFQYLRHVRATVVRRVSARLIEGEVPQLV